MAVKTGRSVQEDLLDLRLKELWENKYPHKPFPHYWFAFGNANLENARIICLTEFHNLPLDQMAIGNFINTHYRPGDVILVEALAAGVETQAKNHRRTQFVHPYCPVQGWEPEDFDELHDQIMGEQKKAFNTLEKSLLHLMLIDLLPQDQAQEALFQFLSMLNAFAKYAILNRRKKRKNHCQDGAETAGSLRSRLSLKKFRFLCFPSRV